MKFMKYDVEISIFTYAYEIAKKCKVQLKHHPANNKIANPNIV